LQRHNAEGYAMSIDYELKRSISDIQSGISRLDSSARRRPARPGQAIIQRVAAQLARVCGDDWPTVRSPSRHRG
jgi:hypothetical protein